MTTYKKNLSNKVFGDDFMHQGKWYRTAKDNAEDPNSCYALPLRYKGCPADPDTKYVLFAWEERKA